MLWLPETFRKERSHAYRLAMQRARLHAREDLLKARNLLPDAEKTPRKAQTAFAQVEKSEGPRPAFPAMARILTGLSMRSGEDKVKISLWDVNVRARFSSSSLRDPHLMSLCSLLRLLDSYFASDTISPQ